MKRLACAVVVAVLITAAIVPACAHTQDKHWEQLEMVLFGRTLTDSKRVGAIQLIEYASALALDEFNNNMTERFKYLQGQNIHGFPENVDEIDFLSSANTHQSYTHRGWDYKYENDLAAWKTRKGILLSTLEHVFDFNPLKGTIIGDVIYAEYDNRCDSFAALVYYVHILGDHEQVKSCSLAQYKKDRGIFIPLARGHVGKGNEDIFYELKHHLRILFDKQEDTRVYRNMMMDIDVLAEKARKLVATNGGINTDEKFDIHKSYLSELFGILYDKVPKLLQKEPFFTKVFPTN